MHKLSESFIDLCLVPSTGMTDKAGIGKFKQFCFQYHIPAILVDKEIIIIESVDSISRMARICHICNTLQKH